MIAAPMFATWGFLHLTLALRFASTLVLRREFDAHEVLAAVDEHRVTALAVLPEMLQEIMALSEATSTCHDTDALRVIAVQGSALRSDLALPAIGRFGDVLYNLRGPLVVKLDQDWIRQTRVLGGRARAAASAG